MRLGKFRFLGNKYLLTTLAFGVWMLFFDQNDFFTQKDRSRQLEEINENISYLTQETERMAQEYRMLKKNPAYLERYARERYRMKRDNEDVYIVE